MEAKTGQTLAYRSGSGERMRGRMTVEEGNGERNEGYSGVSCWGWGGGGGVGGGGGGGGGWGGGEGVSSDYAELNRTCLFPKQYVY